MTWLFAKALRPFVSLAAGASLLLNLALLVPALYMMQVFDRVFGSGSVETLIMLSAITLLLLSLSYVLDTVRQRALAWAGAVIAPPIPAFYLGGEELSTFVDAYCLRFLDHLGLGGEGSPALRWNR